MLLQFTLPVLPSSSASPFRLLFLPSSLNLFCRFAPSVSQPFLSFSLQHNLRLAFSTFSFLFLSVTLLLALSWWVFKLLQLKGSMHEDIGRLSSFISYCFC